MMTKTFVKLEARLPKGFQSVTFVDANIRLSWQQRNFTLSKTLLFAMTICALFYN